MKEMIKRYGKRYFIDAMGGMAQGLFASLLIGTIIGTLGGYIPVASIRDFLLMVASVCKNDFVVGAAIGVGMARAMNAAPLVMYASAIVGAGSYSIGLIVNKVSMEIAAHYLPGAALSADTTKLIAGPGGCFFAVILAVELGMLVSKKTRLDILVTPLVTILPATLFARLVCPYIAYAMFYLGNFINTATEYAPLWMGIVISVVVGTQINHRKENVNESLPVFSYPPTPQKLYIFSNFLLFFPTSTVIIGKDSYIGGHYHGC